ncbi:hypothetical protein O6H91_08G107200 [Diphasiastrum complanatum]|uniref:Uncharacterized protein n=1 Tax=Diphasiastrum complanatum TaxID=34168 RepID=A0ACC2D0W7_DIPCM|nr:hypothetical protein O6H91_08G107200 [Diphasiastrum complanatum]
MVSSNMAPSQMFVKCLNGRTRCLQFAKSSLPYEDLQSIVSDLEGVAPPYLRLVAGTMEFHSDISLVAGANNFFPSITVLLRLRGGKGGFGSLLRGAATKAGQKKTSNFDACRDMSGRRLRHVNAEKKLKEWKADVKERELEKVAEEFLKKERKKKHEDTGIVKDMEIFREATVRNMEEVESAVLSGLKESQRLGVNSKRKKVEALETAAKRACIWMAEGDEEFDEDEDAENEELSRSVDPAEKFQKKEVAECSQKKIVAECIDHTDEEASSSQQIIEPGVIEMHNMSNFSRYCSVDPAEKFQKKEVADNSQKKIVAECIDHTREEAYSPQQISQAAVIFHTTSNCSNYCEEVELYSLNKEVQPIPDGSKIGFSKDIPDIENIHVPIMQNTSDKSGGTDASQLTKEANEEDVLIERPLNFDDFATAKDLEVLGLEKLKFELQACGLKCGGSLSERASRLFLLKTTPLEKLDKKHIAKLKIAGKSS